MAADIERQITKRSKYSRRRTHVDDADISYINERNKKFNEKCERFYGKYTEEIRGNLERGTALWSTRCRALRCRTTEVMVSCCTQGSLLTIWRVLFVVPQDASCGTIWCFFGLGEAVCSALALKIMLLWKVFSKNWDAYWPLQCIGHRGLHNYHNSIIKFGTWPCPCLEESF